MRNYCSVSDLKDPSFVQKMYEVFDDEFFLLLKRNSPEYIGVPHRFWEMLAAETNANIREISTTQLQRREVLISPSDDIQADIAFLLIVGGAPRYYFFPHTPTLSDRVHSLMRSTLHHEFLDRNSILNPVH